MKKRMIKLINDERTRASLTAQKGCEVGASDTCYSKDRADCSTYAFDQCDKDYAACTEGATDNCLIDRASCFGAGVTDRCGTDYDLCHGSGVTDYN